MTTASGIPALLPAATPRDTPHPLLTNRPPESITATGFARRGKWRNSGGRPRGRRPPAVEVAGDLVIKDPARICNPDGWSPDPMPEGHLANIRAVQ
ncbi:MAG: hypothetical protein JOZ09_07345 [Pseudonocardiales bacterium]|nr:hypothetical protein [Pseudonocardiales bacterium]